jgi:hypothetical protein
MRRCVGNSVLQHSNRSRLAVAGGLKAFKSPALRRRSIPFGLSSTDVFMSKKPFEYTHPGKYDPDLLTMVGVLMASCGGIERSIISALIHYRESGRNVGQIHMQFKRRLKQWHLHVRDDLSGNPDLCMKLDQLEVVTGNLFKFRNLIAHSLWMGQDNEATLWLSAVKEKSQKILTLDMPVPKKELIKNVAIAEKIYREHIRLLVEGVLRRSPEQAEGFFRPVSANPSDPTHPSQTGSPYRPEEDC